MRLIGRIFVVVAVAAVLVWGVWSYALGRPDVQFGLFERAASARHEAAKPAFAPASSLRATVCAASPCVLVEAGGYTFLVGAGDGAAEGLETRGLLAPNLDGVLLTDLSAESIDDLAAIREATWRAGRSKPLEVYGPAGVDKVVAGVNAMLEASDAGRTDGLLPRDVASLAVAASIVAEPVSQPIATSVKGAKAAPAPVETPAPPQVVERVFNAGGVSVSRILAGGAESASGQWVYRIDHGDRSVIVAGCGARSGDLVAAAQGMKHAWAIVPAASKPLLAIESKAAKAAGRERAAQFISATGNACLSAQDAAAAVRSAKLSGGMLAPLHPAVVGAPARRAWRESLEQSGVTLALGEPGAVLEAVVPAAPAASEPAKTPDAVTTPIAAATTAPAPAETPVAKAPPPPAPTPTATATPASVLAPKPAVVAPVAPRPTPTPPQTPAAREPTPVATPSPTPRPPRPPPPPAATPAPTPTPTTQPALQDEPFP